MKRSPSCNDPLFLTFRFSAWSSASPRPPLCKCERAESAGSAEEAPLHRQSQSSVHNSNSCSCILIHSGGLSLEGSIFLHFRNYGLASEFGLKIREAAAAAPLSSPALKGCRPNCPIIVRVCLVPSACVSLSHREKGPSVPGCPPPPTPSRSTPQKSSFRALGVTEG